MHHAKRHIEILGESDARFIAAGAGAGGLMRITWPESPLPSTPAKQAR